MDAFAYQLFIRGCSLIIILVLLSVTVWLATKKFGLMRLDKPFDAADLRTWPLSFVVIDSAIYGAIFALIHVAGGDSMYSIGAAAAVATLVALGAVPSIMLRRRK